MQFGARRVETLFCGIIDLFLDGFPFRQIPNRICQR